jgi:hypothetical protein
MQMMVKKYYKYSTDQSNTDFCRFKKTTLYLAYNLNLKNRSSAFSYLVLKFIIYAYFLKF